jgi:hypothetical protein
MWRRPISTIATNSNPFWELTGLQAMKRSDTLFQLRELEFHLSFNQRVVTLDCCATSLNIAELTRPARLTVLEMEDT